MSASEPLMTCRKRRDDVRTRGESLIWDKSGGYLFTRPVGVGTKAAWTRFRFLGNVGTRVPMPREGLKRPTRKCQSTEGQRILIVHREEWEEVVVVRGGP
jgi:hypothetical protein